jgi:hypothetical protein
MAVESVIKFFQLPQWLSCSAERRETLPVAIVLPRLCERVELPRKSLLHRALN